MAKVSINMQLRGLYSQLRYWQMMTRIDIRSLDGSKNKVRETMAKIVELKKGVYASRTKA